MLDRSQCFIYKYENIFNIAIGFLIIKIIKLKSLSKVSTKLQPFLSPYIQLLCVSAGHPSSPNGMKLNDLKIYFWILWT